jgi:hypothetical protein
MSLSVVRETLDLQLQTFTFALSGVDTSNIAEALTRTFPGTDVTSYKAILDTDDSILHAWIQFQGQLESWDMSEGPDTNEISWTCTDQLATYDRLRSRGPVGGLDLTVESAQQEPLEDYVGEEPPPETVADAIIENQIATGISTVEDIREQVAVSGSAGGAPNSDQRMNIPVVYGSAASMTEAQPVFMGLTDDSQYLHVAYMVSEGEIDDTIQTNVYVDGTLAATVTGLSSTPIGKFAAGSGYVEVEYISGSDTQTVNSSLTTEFTEWTSNHRLRGVAYIYCRFFYNGDIFKTFPKVWIDGLPKKVLDVSDSTYKNSSNPANIVYDWMTVRSGPGTIQRVWDTYGLRLPESKIDLPSFIRVFNYSDTDVPLFTSGGNFDRYFMRGVLDTKGSQLNILRKILSHFQGNVIRLDGKYHLINRYGSSVVEALTEDDIFGSIRVADAGRRKKLNTVTVNIPTRGERSNQGGDKIFYKYTWPVKVQDASFFSEDGGEILESTIEAPLLYESDIDATQKMIYYAKRLAQIAINESRRTLSISFVTDLRALNIVPGDVFSLTYSDFGWTAKTWRCTAVSLSNDGHYFINADEHESTDYGDSQTSAYTYPAPPVISNEDYIVAPASVTLDGDTQEYEIDDVTGTIFYYLQITFPEVPIAQTDFYEVQVKAPNDSYRSIPIVDHVTGSGTYTTVFKTHLSNSYFDVRVRAVNKAGYKSDWTEQTAGYVSPVSTPLEVPPIVTGLQIMGLDSQGNSIGQGNDYTFVGTDIIFDWHDVGAVLYDNDLDLTDGLPEVGAGTSGLDGMFSYYEINIYHDGVLKKTRNIKESEYTYTLDANRTDGNGTPSRNVTLTVTVVYKNTLKSKYAASITATNALPSMFTSVNITDITFNSAVFSTSNPATNTDIDKVRIWVSTSSGFTPSESTLVYKGAYSSEIPLQNLETGTKHYIKYSPVDTFGIDDSNLSQEYSLVTATEVDQQGNASFGTDQIKMDLAQGALWIFNKTFGLLGIQLEYNGGNPRLHVGDPNENYFQFEGSEVKLGPDVSIDGTECINQNGFYFNDNCFVGLDTNRWEDTVTGNPYSTINPAGYEFIANTGDDSGIFLRHPSASQIGAGFYDDVIVYSRFVCNFVVDTTTDYNAQVGMGFLPFSAANNMDAGGAASTDNAGYGITYRSGSTGIYVYIRAGNSYTLTQIDSGYSSGDRFDVTFRVTKDQVKVRYERGYGSSGFSNTLTLTSGLPSSLAEDSGIERIFTVGCANADVSGSIKARIAKIGYYTKPV